MGRQISKFTNNDNNHIHILESNMHQYMLKTTSFESGCIAYLFQAFQETKLKY